jgi:hypothetical protein
MYYKFEFFVLKCSANKETNNPKCATSTKRLRTIKLEHESIIRLLTNERNGQKFIHEWILAVCDTASPLGEQMIYWCKQFMCGEEYFVMIIVLERH